MSDLWLNLDFWPRDDVSSLSRLLLTRCWVEIVIVIIIYFQHCSSVGSQRSDHSSGSVRVQPTGLSRVASSPSILALLSQDIAIWFCHQDRLIEADINVPRVIPGHVQKGVSLQVVFVSRWSKQIALAHMRHVRLLFQKELLLMCSQVHMREMRS